MGSSFCAKYTNPIMTENRQKGRNKYEKEYVLFCWPT